MNHITLKLNPYRDRNSISLNEQPLSRYSELSDFMNEPFLNWAYKLMDAVERELNDDFELCVIAEEFEKLFLRDLQNDFDDCLDYSVEDFPINTSIDQRMRMLKKIGDKYRISMADNITKIRVYTNVPEYAKNGFFEYTESTDAFLLILSDKQELTNLQTGNHWQIAVCISDHNQVTYQGNQLYLWEVSRDDLKRSVNSIISRFARIPSIVRMSSSLESQRDKFSQEDRNALAMALEIDLLVIVKDIPPIEIGKTYTPSFVTIPGGNPLPALRMVTTNPEVIQIEGMKLRAVNTGICAIEFYKYEEIAYFSRVNVEVYKDENVKRIELSLQETRTGIGIRQKLNVNLFPPDAADANRITFSSSNNSVAKIDSRTGWIEGVGEGSVTFTATGLSAKASINMVVLPKVSQIRANFNELETVVGDVKRIDITMFPDGCYDYSWKWTTTDSSVAKLAKTKDNIMVLQAVGIGDCVIKIMPSTGGCEDTINVRVISTFERRERENSHGALTVQFLAAVLAIAIKQLFLPQSMVCSFVCWGLSAITGFLSIQNNSRDSGWAVILAAATFFLTRS